MYTCRNIWRYNWSNFYRGKSMVESWETVSKIVSDTSNDLEPAYQRLARVGRELVKFIAFCVIIREISK